LDRRPWSDTHKQRLPIRINSVLDLQALYGSHTRAFVVSVKHPMPWLLSILQFNKQTESCNAEAMARRRPQCMEHVDGWSSYYGKWIQLIKLAGSTGSSNAVLVPYEAMLADPTETVRIIGQHFGWKERKSEDFVDPKHMTVKVSEHENFASKSKFYLSNIWLSSPLFSNRTVLELIRGTFRSAGVARLIGYDLDPLLEGASDTRPPARFAPSPAPTKPAPHFSEVATAEQPSPPTAQSQDTPLTRSFEAGKYSAPEPASQPSAGEFAVGPVFLVSAAGGCLAVGLCCAFLRHRRRRAHQT
jgi:hypothetical protein